MAATTMTTPTVRTSTMTARTTTAPTTLPWLVRRGVLTLWHELPQSLVAGAFALVTAIPFGTALLADAASWLLALTTVPIALALTALARFTAAAAQGRRMAWLPAIRPRVPDPRAMGLPVPDPQTAAVRVPDSQTAAVRVPDPQTTAVRVPVPQAAGLTASHSQAAGVMVDPTLALVMAVVASLAGFGLAAGGPAAVIGAVGAATLLLVAPLALAYGAVRGRTGLAALRGGIILAAFRPTWTLTLLALGVIGGFAVVASVGFLGLVVVPLQLFIATSIVTAMLEDIDRARH